MSKDSTAVKNMRTVINQLANMQGVKFENTSDGVSLQSSTFNLEVIIEENRLGMYLTVLDTKGRYLIDHYYDTQYTDMTELNRVQILADHADSISANIKAIANNQVMVGRHKGRTAMILPFQTGYIRVWAGVIVQRSKEFESLDEAMKDGQYEPLKWKCSTT